MSKSAFVIAYPANKTGAEHLRAMVALVLYFPEIPWS